MRELVSAAGKSLNAGLRIWGYRVKRVKTIFKVLPVFAVLAGGTLFASEMFSALSASAGEPFPDELIAEGEAIFDELGCAGCHFPIEPVEGNTAPRLENLAERYTEDDIAALLDAPPGPMPRFDLDDADRRALAAFLLSTF